MCDTRISIMKLGASELELQEQEQKKQTFELVTVTLAVLTHQIFEFHKSGWLLNVDDPALTR